MRALIATICLAALVSGCSVAHVRKVPIYSGFPEPSPGEERRAGFLAVEDPSDGTNLGESPEGTVFGLYTVRDRFDADAKRSDLVKNALHSHAADAGISLAARGTNAKPWDTPGLVDGQFILTARVTSFAMKNVTSGPPFYSHPTSIETAIEVETTMYAPGNPSPVWRQVWKGTGADKDATQAAFESLEALRPIFKAPGFVSAVGVLQAKAQADIDKKVAVLAASGDTTGALLALAAAYRGCPEGARSESLFARIVETTKLIPRQPLSEDGRRFAVQADTAAQEKKYDEAIRLFGEAIAVCPWWSQGHYNRSLLLAERGQHREAINSMKRFIALSPESPEARKGQDRIYEWEARVK